MEVSEGRPAIWMGPVDWFSPSLVVGVSLALLAALLACVHLAQREPLSPRASALAPPAAVEAGPVAAAQVRVAPAAVEAVEAPVEFRCVQGTRVRKQGSSYSSAGSC